jgi:hypothetical protein
MWLHDVQCGEFPSLITMTFLLTIVYTLFIILSYAAPSYYAAYNVARDYSGSTFFSQWDFYGNYGG